MNYSSTFFFFLSCVMWIETKNSLSFRLCFLQVHHKNGLNIVNYWEKKWNSTVVPWPYINKSISSISAWNCCYTTKTAIFILSHLFSTIQHWSSTCDTRNLFWTFHYGKRKLCLWSNNELEIELVHQCTFLYESDYIHD